MDLRAGAHHSPRLRGGRVTNLYRRVAALNLKTAVDLDGVERHALPGIAKPGFFLGRDAPQTASNSTAHHPADERRAVELDPVPSGETIHEQVINRKPRQPAQPERLVTRRGADDLECPHPAAGVRVVHAEGVRAELDSSTGAAVVDDRLFALPGERLARGTLIVVAVSCSPGPSTKVLTSANAASIWVTASPGFVARILRRVLSTESRRPVNSPG